MKPIKSAKHLARVAELPCVVCESDEVQVHHIRDMNFCGAGQKASDWFTFPLCQGCHALLHSDIKAWEMSFGKQIKHVEQTLEMLYG